MTGIVNADNTLTGVFTDGDLRRLLDKENDIFSLPVTQIMTENFVHSKEKTLAAETLKLMEDKKISGLFIVDQDLKPVGALNMHDLLKAGVI